MTERQWTQKLTARIKKERPDIVWFKLGDTYGGHKKPSDVIMVNNARTVFVEIKEGDKKLTPNEILSAIRVTSSGGWYHILRYYPNKQIIWTLYGTTGIDIFDNIDQFMIWL
jgi:hypothetical protein